MYATGTSLRNVLMGLSVAVAMTFATSSVNAATFGQITNAGPNPNDGVFAIYGTNQRAGWYGADIYLLGGPADIQVTLLGYEAGATNTFVFQDVNLFFGGGGGNTWNPGGIELPKTVLNVAPGLLDFSFLTSLVQAFTQVDNGSNPDDSTGGAGDKPNFFATFALNENAASGLVLDLWFDDGGGANDDNHDDLAIRLSIVGPGVDIRLTPVPLPPALLLFASALAGLGYLARRRRQAGLQLQPA